MPTTTDKTTQRVRRVRKTQFFIWGRTDVDILRCIADMAALFVLLGLIGFALLALAITVAGFIRVIRDVGEDIDEDAEKDGL